MDPQSGHILVLEDHPAHRKAITFSLAAAGFRVATAAEAARALVLAKHEHFDMVVADYYLPDYPGTDFVRQLRAMDRYENVPVILLTGRANELDRRRLENDLSILLVSKPCSMARLAEMAHKCIAMSRAHDRAEGAPSHS